MIENKVKLVIWDLDDTFWQGTLEEGGVTPIPENHQRVRDLAERGIISSICSKNDYSRTQAKLTELGMWDHFVFPAISFSPKGKTISEMIEAVALRPENVLVIDDNRMNLEEIRFFNPGIMAAHPDDVLHLLCDHPNTAGKADPQLIRLNQYRLLQRKVEERRTTSLSNEEFLRASNIQITLDYDVMTNFDRVVELINRTNQLNYTKKRLEAPQEIEEFRATLDAFGHHAGCIRVRDSYGDYGLVGFYLMHQRSHTKRLVHFVFSCRTMHMGIEQYVYEMLGRPDISIAEPVSYGLNSHASIDWIRQGGAADNEPEDLSGSRKLVLLGGCDLLQLTSYCSSNRLEFVNRNEGKFRIRYDDPSFVLSPRDLIRSNAVIQKIPYWNYDDAVRFDEGLASAEIVVVSLWSGMNGVYYEIPGGLRVRLTLPDAKRIRDKDPEWFDNNFVKVRLDDDERLDLIFRSLGSIEANAPNGQIFVIGCSTLGAKKDNQVQRRTDFNASCRTYCDKHSGRFRFVDVDATVPTEAVIGNGHFTRAGYYALAKNILARAEQGAAVLKMANAEAQAA